METENVALNNSGERKVVEQAGKVLPHVGVSILTETFIVESIDLSNLLGLVVASQDGDSVRMTHFVADQEGNCLN
jgi:hypothetical protein